MEADSSDEVTKELTARTVARPVEDEAIWAVDSSLSDTVVSECEARGRFAIVRLVATGFASVGVAFDGDCLECFGREELDRERLSSMDESKDSEGVGVDALGSVSTSVLPDDDICVAAMVEGLVEVELSNKSEAGTKEAARYEVSRCSPVLDSCVTDITDSNVAGTYIFVLGPFL